MQIDSSYKPYGYIYKITNPINDKCYIGQTTDTDIRFGDYKKLHCKGQPKLYNALKKYGPGNFIYETLDTAPDQIVLNYLEDFYIQCLDTRKSGYNCREGGSSGKHSEETKLKMSKIKQGKPLSHEHRQKISNALKNKKVTNITRYKLSQSHKGITHSTESKLKMSLSHTGKVLSDKTKLKIIHSNKGLKRTENTKEKISLNHVGMSGRKHSIETRQKMSISHMKSHRD